MSLKNWSVAGWVALVVTLHGGAARAGDLPAVKATFDSIVSGTGIGGGGVFKWTFGSGDGFGTADRDTGKGKNRLGDIKNFSVGGTVDVAYKPITFGGAGGEFETFCIERGENISYSGNYTYELTKDIAGTPQDQGTSGTYPGMGAQAAENLRKLFGAYWSDNLTTTELQAFQLSIWEIVADTSTGLDLTAGTYKPYTSVGSDTTTAKYKAQAWLGNIQDDTNDNLAQSYNLVVLTKDGIQDQIGIVAPCPPAVCMAIAGLLPLAVCGWRRRAAKKDA